MGKRYIEVFKSNRSEMNWVVERQGPQGGGTPGSDGVLRCRGLPFGTIDAQVREFFSDYEIVEGGVVIPTDAMGRPGGEAYVQFASQAQADLAMGKDKEKMGHRWRISGSEGQGMYSHHALYPAGDRLLAGREWSPMGDVIL
jgi:heterogeneous nuclear ribonucleoprotein F/H